MTVHIRKCYVGGMFKKILYGKQCEDFALKTYSKQGYRLLERNLRLKFAECDLVMENSKGLLLVEVRGKKSDFRRPSLFLSGAKLQRLKYSALVLSQRYKKSVQVELFEVLGELPSVRSKRFPIYFD